MREIGVIGLGSMGAAIAGRLLEVGYQVRVWNRSPDPVHELVERGAIAVACPADAFAPGVTISMLANDAAFEAVLTRDVLSGLGDVIHINMSSISPAAVRRAVDLHADAGVAYVAAPVLGRPPVAAAGKLQVLAAGGEAPVEQVRGVLEALSDRIWLLGEDPAQANVTKTAMNYMLIHAIQSIGEGLALVESAGVNSEQFVDLATSTLFSGTAHTVYGGIIRERRFRPAGFALELGLKDLNLAEGVAAQAGINLPLAPVLRSLFEEALSDPQFEGADWSAITELTRTSTHQA